MLSNYTKRELTDSKEPDPINSSLIFDTMHESIKPYPPIIPLSTSPNSSKADTIHSESSDIDDQKHIFESKTNIVPTIPITNDSNNNNYVLTQLPLNINHDITQDIDFKQIENNGPPYICPLCISHGVHLNSFNTYSKWIEHWNSFHFLEFFHSSINNIEEEKKNANIKSMFVENILFDETYFGLIIEYFTPKQYIKSISLISKFHYSFPKKNQYNFQIMLRMITNHFFDIKSGTIIPIQNIYNSIKLLEHFTVNVNLSHILPFTNRTNDGKKNYKFRVYPDTTVKSILWQYDLLQMYKSLQIGYLQTKNNNGKRLKWNLSTKIFDIVSKYNTKNIAINLSPKSATFTQQLKFIQWFVPEIKNKLNLPTNEIESVKRRSWSIKTQLKKCSSLGKLKKCEYYVNKCIHRIQNNDTSIEEKKTDEFNGFYMFSSKLLSVDKIIENKISEYENKYVILNQHIVTSKKKAQTNTQLTQINAVERDISRMDIDAFEMDEKWVTQKKKIISEIENGVKKQKSKVLGQFEEWKMNDIIDYLQYIYDRKIRFSDETMKKFKICGLNGSKIIDINDSLLVLCGIGDGNIRKLFMKGINELLNNYGTHKYCKTQICCICTVNEVNSVCIPCGHCCYCTACRKQCMRHYSTSKCPICRAKIVKIVQIYKAGMTK